MFFWRRKKFFAKNGESLFLKKGNPYDVVLDTGERLFGLILFREIDLFLLFRKKDRSFVYLNKLHIESIRERKDEKKKEVKKKILKESLIF